MPVEFVVDEIKRDVVEQNLQRIQDLFNVRVTITNGTADKIWVTLNGGREEKAKGYIQALTLPEQHSSVVLPASLIGQLGPRSTEHLNLESEYGVVIRYPKDTEAVIAGNAYDVVLASSKLEDLKSKLSNAVTVSKTSKPKNPQPKANRPLAEFASKLGYEQDHIDAVFEKLGPTVDKNTFLNELINLSRYKSKTVDDRRSPAMARSFNWPNGTQQEPFALHANSAMHHSQRPFAPDSAVVARGMIARSSGQTISGNNCPSSGLSSRSYRPLNPGSNPMGYPLDLATYGMESSRVLTRGMIARSSSPTTQGNSSTVYSHPQNNWLEGIPNGLMAPQGSDHGLLNSDPVQVDVMVDQLVTSKYKQCPQSDLRHVVIDGSNVAMSHGNNKVFSCRGIALCVEWFLKRGHTQITVFVPTWRKETARIDNPITDQHLLHQLESQGYLTFTPSRKVNGRRIVCYDDRFVVRLAHTTDGVIVSNDNFKDLAQEKPSWREVIEQRLLMYSFVNDMFMPPDDPLGRHGPTLDEFLRKGTPTHRRQCPYGRRCTYGARCKYHHPEREDQRLPIYQKLKDLFPTQDSLILAAMKKYPHEKDADVLASYVLNMIH